MTGPGLMTFGFWLAVIGATIALMSLLAYLSYMRFLHGARGADGWTLPRDEEMTRLDTLADPLTAANPGRTGLSNLLDNTEAFAIRALLAANAGRSLDLMYYIWRTDVTGWLLLNALMDAADRGVRVRLLLDDVNVQGLDRVFLALNQHPMIEVRLFNPTRNRGHFLRRFVEMALGLSRFNRRMHGKMWIADAQMAVLGGRNIGDTYFGEPDRGARVSHDADMLVAGAMLPQLCEVFDNFWNEGPALPIVTLWPRLTVNMPRFRRRLARHVRAPEARAIMSRAMIGQEDTGLHPIDRLRWTNKATLLADMPDKAFGKRSAPFMSESVANLLAAAQRDVRIVTPYFVPGRPGMKALANLGARNIRVTLLTNALVVTDQILVHGAYSRYRRGLLGMGVRLFEFAPKSRQSPGRRKGRDVLHSKVFLIDGTKAVVGSLNFDLRSAFMNTELGLQFEEPELLAELMQMFDSLTAPKVAYDVGLNGRRVTWTAHRKGRDVVLSAEPEAPVLMQAVSWFVGHLPLHSYL